MKGLRLLVVLGVVVVVSLIAGAYAAGQDAPPMTGPDAKEFTERALTFSGFDAVEVTGEPRAELFDAGAQAGREGGERQDQAEAGPPIPVWVVPVAVSDRQIELYVARQSNRAVNLDDALPGGGFVLNEEQFQRLERFRLNLAREELREDRQGPALVAGLLIVVSASLLVFSALKGRGRGRTGSSSEGPEVDAQPVAG